MAAIIGYTFGEYSKSRYAEYIKNGSLAIVGLALLYSVVGNCPVVLFQLAIPLLLTALIVKAIFWAVFRYLVK
ncbi:MAG: hypothetical protein R3F48_06170 [Candidatus Zixiibacteriota bacterium]